MARKEFNEGSLEQKMFRNFWAAINILCKQESRETIESPSSYMRNGFSKSYGAIPLAKNIARALLETLNKFPESKHWVNDGKFKKGSMGWRMLQEFYGLSKEFYIPEESDEYWSKLVEALTEFREKYKEMPLSEKLGLALADALDGEWKIQKEKRAHEKGGE